MLLDCICPCCLLSAKFSFTKSQTEQKHVYHGDIFHKCLSTSAPIRLLDFIYSVSILLNGCNLVRLALQRIFYWEEVEPTHETKPLYCIYITCSPLTRQKMRRFYPFRVIGSLFSSLNGCIDIKGNLSMINLRSPFKTKRDSLCVELESSLLHLLCFCSFLDTQFVIFSLLSGCCFEVYVKTIFKLGKKIGPCHSFGKGF